MEDLVKCFLDLIDIDHQLGDPEDPEIERKETKEGEHGFLQWSGWSHKLQRDVRARLEWLLSSTSFGLSTVVRVYLTSYVTPNTPDVERLGFRQLPLSQPPSQKPTMTLPAS